VDSLGEMLVEPFLNKPTKITMKKHPITALLALTVLLFLPFTVFARSNHHRIPSPSPAPIPPVATPTSTIQWGAFTGNTKPLGSYQAFFIGDGDSFTADAQGFTDPLVVYWESNYTAAQISSGKADSFLKNWATQMKTYNKPIIFDVLDEMNLTGEYPYAGNTGSFKTAFQHVAALFSGRTNVKLAYDPNVAFSGNPVSSFVAYYPGDAYVDLVGLDGFDFGGQTFAQVFSASLSAMKSDFPSKPLWILSTGTVDSPISWISGLKSTGVAGVIYFDYQDFTISASTLQSL
jgi:hypothetical protein